MMRIASVKSIASHSVMRDWPTGIDLAIGCQAIMETKSSPLKQHDARDSLTRP